MGISAQKKFTQSELREIFDVCSRKDLTGDWCKIRDVLNKRLGKDYNESTYRKRYAAYCEMKAACRDIDPDFTGDDTDLTIQKRELERAKIQFRDERNAWQKQNYNTARVQQKLDYLEEYIRNRSAEKLDIRLRSSNNNKTAIVCCSDWHIGCCYNNEYGVYNSDIAKRRIAEYASKAISICESNDVTSVIIAGLGDNISGSIHKSVQITNRENVIEQIMLASELMLSFLKEFVDRGLHVVFTNVSGNHSRIDTKNDAIKDERLDDLIGWYCNTHLCDFPNFTYIKAEDTSFSNVYGCWFCHGDYDSFGKSGLSNLVLAKGYKPKAVFMAHYHTMAIDDCYDVKICRSGCLGGSGDGYTVQKRLKGKPSQLMAIMDDGEINQYYNITFEEA